CRSAGNGGIERILSAGGQAGGLQPAAESGRPYQTRCTKLVGAGNGERGDGRCNRRVRRRGKSAMTQLTYYDRPLVKQPVWVWSIPTYFYAGATAGASLALGAAVQVLHGSSSNLVRRSRLLGAIGISIGASLLIYDLGRPERFMNMLRVFRPTSPMNVGSWLL